MLENSDNILRNLSAKPIQAPLQNIEQTDISETDELSGTIGASIAPFYAEQSEIDVSSQSAGSSEGLDPIFSAESQENSQITDRQAILPSDYRGSSNINVNNSTENKTLKSQVLPQQNNSYYPHIDLMKMANIAPVIFAEPYSLNSSQDFPVMNPAMTISPSTFHMLMSETPILGISDNLRNELIDKYIPNQTSIKNSINSVAVDDSETDRLYPSHESFFGHIDRIDTGIYDFSDFTPVISTALPIHVNSPLSQRNLLNTSQVSRELLPSIPSVKPVYSL